MGKNLVVYDAPDLREHGLNATVVEKARGMRIAKERTSRKIDAAVTLTMAALAAVELPAPAPRLDFVL